MVLRYDALKKPQAKKWINASELQRIRAVLDHHAKEPDELPNERLHATIHVVVENQCAVGDETPVAAAVERLKKEGLDRHDAVHAVGAVLSKYIWSVLGGSGDPPPDNWSEQYFEEVRELTAKKWADEFGEEE